MFINKQLNQEINNSFHFGGVEFNYGKPLTVEESTRLASHLMGIIPIDEKCNNSKKMFMTEPISIYIKAENMNTKGVDILIYKDDYSYLKYTNEDFFKSKNLYKAKNIRGTIGKYIHLTQKCSSWNGVYITEGALNYIKYLHNLTDEGFKAKIFSYSPVKEILPMKQVLSSERKELFQKTSPFPIVIEDDFDKDKTSFIVTPSLSGIHSYMHLNDMPTNREYSLYLSGVQFVSTETTKEIVFYKVTSVNNNISAYIDIDKDKLCSENLYISELSIIKIMERFDLSFSEFKEKVLTYNGEDYCMEEILEKEIANPKLRSHQLDDINKADAIQPEEDVCLIIENEPISYVGLSKLSEICGKEKFPESLYPGMFVVIETAMFMLLKDGYKTEEMVSVTNWFPKGSNKKLIVLASNFNALKEANEVLDLECKKIKIKEVGK